MNLQQALALGFAKPHPQSATTLPQGVYRIISIDGRHHYWNEAMPELVRTDTPYGCRTGTRTEFTLSETWHVH